MSKPGEPDKPLFPLVFCRQCGTAYYRVSLVQRRRRAAGLRRARTVARKTMTVTADAYLYVSETAPGREAEARTARSSSRVHEGATADGSERVSA